MRLSLRATMLAGGLLWGGAIRVPKSRDPSARVQDAIQTLLRDERAKAKAASFARAIAEWDGPTIAAEKLLKRYGA